LGPINESATYQASALFLHSLRPRSERVEGPKVNGVKTVMICTHVLNRGGHGVESPLDRGIVLSGQPKTQEANGRMVQKSLDRKELPAPRGDGGFVLG
jgi:hypothetical protein